MLDRQLIQLPNKKNIALLNYQSEWQPIFYYDSGIHERALLSAFQQLDNMFSYYSRVTVVLLQLHQAEFQTDNLQIRDLMKQLQNHIKSHYNAKRIGYAWAREHGESGTNQHYHIAVMINGSLCNNGFHIVHKANQLWREIYPENYSWMVMRSTFALHRHHSEIRTKTARMRMSYGFKKRSKETVPSRLRYGFSRLKHNAQLTVF